MKAKENITEFIDSPPVEEMRQAVSAWPIPELPAELKTAVKHESGEDFWEIGRRQRLLIGSTRRVDRQNRMTLKTLDWLYAFIRLTVKRGRVYDLREVLQTRKADCLGYCKLFTVLGRYCGLDCGVADVIVDNRGITMPHSAVLVRLINRKPTFLDFWYGSKNPHHRRLGLRVKFENRWKVVDVESTQLRTCAPLRAPQTPEPIPSIDEASCLDYTYLPDSCVDGITLYIEGNRFLKQGENFKAMEAYSQAIKLYPLNARVFYNRAIAFEKIGELSKAMRDYARALKGEAAIQRTLAVQPEDIVNLIKLDEQNVPESQQQMYLVWKGSVTGKRVSITEVARKAGISVTEAKSILDSIVRNLAKKVE
jgi:tetratricopeptide (TPR) repeat protein